MAHHISKIGKCVNKTSLLWKICSEILKVAFEDVTLLRMEIIKFPKNGGEVEPQVRGIENEMRQRKREGEQ